ncbi:MAG: hypothetical protein ACI9OJ_005274 [Myxococcota bacterium]|jgi:hypothetical protein
MTPKPIPVLVLTDMLANVPTFIEFGSRSQVSLLLPVKDAVFAV